MPAAMSTLLKVGSHRTVRVADGGTSPASSPGPVVVKRFARGGPLGWLRDRRNARREFALLTELHRRGLPVPRPLGIERAGAGYEVAMERIDGAPLLDVLASDRTDATDAELARELGRLLARLQRAGLDHPDLHARNVLLRPNGELVAIDFHAARLHATAGDALPPTWRRDLVVATAGLRDVTSRTFRARALAAWLDALAAPPAPRRELARSIEDEARRLRHRVVQKRRLRWTRAGSACRAVDRGAARGFVANELTEADVEALLAALRDGRHELAGRRHWLFVRGPERDVRAVYENAARLLEHGLPAARPGALWVHPDPVAVLALPAGSRPAATVEAAEHERFLARLADRGLALGARPEWWRGPEGELALGRVTRLGDGFIDRPGAAS